MGVGVSGPTGLVVPRFVEMEQNRDTGTVPILYRSMEGFTAPGIPNRVNTVFSNVAL